MHMIRWASFILFIEVFAAVPLDRISSSTCYNYQPECWFVLYNPSGLTDFSIPIDHTKEVTGVITINGEIVSYSQSKSESGFLEFRYINGQNDVIIQLVLQVGKNELENVVYVRGIRQRLYYPRGSNSGGAQDYIISPEANETAGWWLFKDNRIRIQISDLEASKCHEYKLYLGDPGEAVPYLFNYGSEENWQQFKNLRLNATNMVVHDDEALLASYTSISVCSDAQPVLCDKSREIIEARLGETSTLRCSGFGAPYLSSKWEDNTGRSIDNFHQDISNETADNFIVSTLVIERFNVSHIGSYICTILNENFNLSVKKSFSLKYSRKIFIIRSPDKTFFSNPNENLTQFSWIIDGWPLTAVRLVCENSSDLVYNVEKAIFPDYGAVPRLELRFSLDAKNAPDAFKCDVVDGSILLEESHFTKLQSLKDKNTVNVGDDIVEDGDVVVDVKPNRKIPYYIIAILVISVSLIAVVFTIVGMWLSKKYPSRTSNILKCLISGSNETSYDDAVPVDGDADSDDEKDAGDATGQLLVNTDDQDDGKDGDASGQLLVYTADPDDGKDGDASEQLLVDNTDKHDQGLKEDHEKCDGADRRVERLNIHQRVLQLSLPLRQRLSSSTSENSLIPSPVAGPPITEC